MDRKQASQAIRNIEWRDLVRMTAAEGVIECLHPLPWLLGAWTAAHFGLWLAAIPASFMFFLTALRLNHEAIHHNLGLTPLGHRLVLHCLSTVMLGSNHAIAHNHLVHHRHIGTQADTEGKCGRMGFWRVLAHGPVFPWENHREAWTHGGPETRKRMAIDLALNGMIPATALASGSPALAVHLGLMLVAQCLTAFFAVWITHQGCEDEGLVARTQRNALINFFTYNMFFHLEHHLFPAVPVKHLPRLAARLDSELPHVMMRARHVVPSIRLPLPA